MKNFVEKADVLDLTAPYDVASGAGALVGSIFGVAVNKLTSGSAGAFVLKGRCTLAKATGASWAQGDVLYWDDSAKNVTKTSMSNTKIGFAAAAAGSSDTTGDVVLNGTV